MMPALISRTEIRIPLIFVLFAALWIVVSDSVVNLLFPELQLQRQLQTAKGLFFITTVACILYLLIRSDVRRDQARLREIEKLHNIQKSVFSAMRRCFIVVDNEWNITMCNSGGLALLGKDEFSQVIGKRIWGLLPASMVHVLREISGQVGTGSAVDHEMNSGLDEWWAVQFVPFPGGLGIFLDDISVTKNAALREAELLRQRAETLARLQMHIDRLPIGYIITDAEFRFQYLNPAAEAIFGYKTNDLRGKQAVGTILPESGRESIETQQQRWRQGDPAAHGMHVCLASHRGAIYCDWFNTPILSETGELQYVISMIQDVTERLNADEDIRRSEERYRAVVEDQNEFIIRWLPDGTRSFVNPSYCRFRGMEMPDLLNENVYAVLTLPDAVSLKALILGLSPESPSAILDAQSLRADGATRTLRFSHRALFDSRGLITEIQSVARDLTEQLAAEEQLRRSEERFRVLIERASEGILTIDHGRFTSCNQKAADILRMSIDDIIGRTPEERSPEFQPDGKSSADKAVNNIGQALAGINRVFEWDHLRGDGSIVTIEVSLGRVQFGEEPSLLCFWRDITERKAAEQHLHSSRQQLRALTARLDEVREEERKELSRELHDGLGQSLTALKIDISLMKRFLGSANAAPEQIETILSMNNLVDQALQMTRTLSRDLRPALLEETGLGYELDRLLMEVCGKAKLAYRCDVPRYAVVAEPAKALACYRIAQEALTNVVRHASASSVSIRVSTEHDATIMEIEDDGIGIDTSMHWRTGALGIVGMRERAEQNGGRLLVEALPGKGTKVSVVFSSESTTEKNGGSVLS